MWDFGPSLCMSQHCSLWVNRVMNFTLVDLAPCFVGGFCRPCLSGSFHPFSRGYTGSASSPPGFCSAITPDIPVCGFTGLRELVLDRHCGQEQLSGAEWRHFPSLCFPDGEIAFNLLANLWWWNSLLVCLFRLLWHPPMQASVAPFGCQGSGGVGTSRNSGC